MKKVVVCDLEKTLGEFGGIIGSEPNETILIYLRPQLKRGLSLLSEDYKLVIATTQVEPFADTALRGAGVRNFFAGIYDWFDFKTEYEVKKSYKPIAKDFGIPQDLVSENILVIGDNERTDQPERDSNIIFIQVDEIIHVKAPRISMTSLAELINKIDVERGFNSGFHDFKRKDVHSSPYTFFEKETFWKGGEEKGRYTPKIEMWTSISNPKIEEKEFTITTEEIESIKSELARAKQYT